MQANTYSELSALDLMKLCVWREARDEGILGKRGVAHVIQNRANHPSWWGHDIRSVILKSWQFSSFRATDPNSKKWPAQGDPSFQDCKNICEAVAAGNDEDITDGATSYYDISIPPPAWASDGSNVLTLSVGHLRFYKLAPPAAVTDIDLAM
jgi:spore germination cell wall hydrolase CwlJ-like protein